MSTATLYREFRKSSPFMLVGSNAAQSLEAAKTLAQFRKLEAAGLVKIEATPDESPDPSFYDTWEHLSDRSRDKLKAKYWDDCWVVSTYYRCKKCHVWRAADTICGCSGYRDVCSPFDNGYVIELMRSAVEAASDPE